MKVFAQHRRLQYTLLALTCCASSAARAHIGSDAGWFHPLSGLDHFLAMVAVGAWSGQIGGRAIWTVPSAFVGFMLVGGLLGLEQVNLPGVEIGVAASVVMLGLAIGLEKKFPLLVAAAVVGMFGIFHGYAHGYEMPVMENKLSYVAGFLFTTACLHILGALGAHYLLQLHNGQIVLRCLGYVSAVCGSYLTYQVATSG